MRSSMESRMSTVASRKNRFFERLIVSAAFGTIVAYQTARAQEPLHIPSADVSIPGLA
jgi:hypothetical protein